MNTIQRYLLKNYLHTNSTWTLKQNWWHLNRPRAILSTSIDQVGSIKHSRLPYFYDSQTSSFRGTTRWYHFLCGAIEHSICTHIARTNAVADHHSSRQFSNNGSISSRIHSVCKALDLDVASHDCYSAGQPLTYGSWTESATIKVSAQHLSPTYLLSMEHNHLMYCQRNNRANTLVQYQLHHGVQAWGCWQGRTRCSDVLFHTAANDGTFGIASAGFGPLRQSLYHFQIQATKVSKPPHLCKSCLKINVDTLYTKDGHKHSDSLADLLQSANSCAVCDMISEEIHSSLQASWAESFGKSFASVSLVDLLKDFQDVLAEGGVSLPAQLLVYLQMNSYECKEHQPSKLVYRSVGSSRDKWISTPREWHIRTTSRPTL